MTVAAESVEDARSLVGMPALPTCLEEELQGASGVTMRRMLRNVCCPFRARLSVTRFYPGRCPGLMCAALSGRAPPFSRCAPVMAGLADWLSPIGDYPHHSVAMLLSWLSPPFSRCAPVMALPTIQSLCSCHGGVFCLVIALRRFLQVGGFFCVENVARECNFFCNFVV